MMRKYGKRPRFLNDLKMELKKPLTLKNRLKSPTKRRRTETRKDKFSLKSTAYVVLTKKQIEQLGFYDPRKSHIRYISQNVVPSNECLSNLDLVDKTTYLKSQFYYKKHLGQNKLLDLDVDRCSWEQLLYPTSTKFLFGLHSQVALIETFLTNPYQIGCFLTGTIGTGKTTLTNLLLAELGYRVVLIDLATEKDGFQRAVRLPSVVKNRKAVIVVDNCSLNMKQLYKHVEQNIVDFMESEDTDQNHCRTKWIIIPDDEHQNTYREIQAYACVANIAFPRYQRDQLVAFAKFFPDFEKKDECVQTYLHAIRIPDIRHFVISMQLQSIETNDHSLPKVDKKDSNESPFMALRNTFGQKCNSDKILNHSTHDMIHFVHDNLIQVASQKRSTETMHDLADSLDSLSLANVYYENDTFTTHLVKHAVTNVQSNLPWNFKYTYKKEYNYESNSLPGYDQMILGKKKE